MNSDEELRLIKRVLDGNRNAFEDLVVDNQKNVYNLALKMTKNEDDALDISQEAFIKAYRLLDTFRGDSRFSVWLYRLTYNLCVDFLRKRPRRAAVSLSYQDDSSDVQDIEIPDLRNLPEDTVIRKETRRSIADCIGELNMKHREIIVMREINGMSYGEIAETLEVNEGTVKSRLARARNSLAGILIEKGTFQEFNRLKLRKEVE